MHGGSQPLCARQGVPAGNYPHFWVYSRCHEAFAADIVRAAEAKAEYVRKRKATTEDGAEGGSAEEEEKEEPERTPEELQAEEAAGEAAYAAEVAACKQSKGRGEKLFSAHEMQPHLGKLPQ